LNQQLDFYCCNQHLILHHSKAVYWVEQQTLLLADLHLGKDAHFRKAGIAVPQVITYKDIGRLQQLISHFHPKKVIFLGDLFHSDYNRSLIAFQKIIKENDTVGFVLIKGNHDIIGQRDLDNLGLHKIYDKLILPPFSFTHHPARESEYYNFCGHVHPGIIIRGKGRQGIRLPVFYFGKDQAILPAFASFSGKFIVKTSEGDSVFAVAEKVVFEVN